MLQEKVQPASSSEEYQVPNDVFFYNAVSSVIYLSTSGTTIFDTVDPTSVVPPRNGYPTWQRFGISGSLKNTPSRLHETIQKQL